MGDEPATTPNNRECTDKQSDRRGTHDNVQGEEQKRCRGNNGGGRGETRGGMHSEHHHQLRTHM